jgi:SAM-dependent methyltransferase
MAIKRTLKSLVTRLSATPLFRSAVHLILELRQTFSEHRRTNVDSVDLRFRSAVDPFRYASNPLELERLSIQRDLLDSIRGESLFGPTLEVGGAEGHFTEVLASRCDSLLVVDLSPTALARIQARCAWDSHVRFDRCDLLTDPIPGAFNLVVATGVLEYFTRRPTLKRVRKKLVDAMSEGGYLLVESTRSNPVIENAWWRRLVIRGKAINDFIAADPTLSVERQILTDVYAITMLRKMTPLSSSLSGQH